MVLQTIKFSQFSNAGDLANNETTVGLEAGANAQFNNPWTFLAPGTTAARPIVAASMYYRLRLNTTLELYEYYDPVLSAWVQITNSGEMFVWEVVTTTPILMTSNHGYIINLGAGLDSLSLPILSVVGDEIAIAGQSSGGWILTQNAGQSINFGNESTTVGVTGSLSSTNRFDYIRLLCIEANLTWNVIGGVGNITIA